MDQDSVEHKLQATFLPNYKISDELIASNSFWICTSLFVATHDDIENTSIVRELRIQVCAQSNFLWERSRDGDALCTPSPYKQFLPLPTAYFKMFWKDSLMTMQNIEVDKNESQVALAEEAR